MFKFAVLSVLLAVAAAAPAPGLVHAAAPLAYSAVVGSVPTSVSHQSSSVVHSHAIAAPVVRAAPVLQHVHAAPVVHSAPLVHAAPVVSAYSAPVLSHHGLVGAPLAYGVHGVHGVHGSVVY